MLYVNFENGSSIKKTLLHVGSLLFEDTFKRRVTFARGVTFARKGLKINKKNKSKKTQKKKLLTVGKG